MFVRLFLCVIACEDINAAVALFRDFFLLCVKVMLLICFYFSYTFLFLFVHEHDFLSCATRVCVLRCYFASHIKVWGWFLDYFFLLDFLAIGVKNSIFDIFSSIRLLVRYAVEILC